MKKILCILSAGCFMHAAIYAQTDWHISGNNNTAFGFSGLNQNSTGSDNIAIGTDNAKFAKVKGNNCGTI